ncbi:ACT domain-containing protein [Shimia thalassica]|uniref:ACT domain-containing protein n=1 Tax=Shimia thalassica TaxID=1715693 RepID=UPI002735B05C|nr:ACT domain-containing protein [Shimia thalassica]MDP2520708.1 ACT domain-containing protein [Shimia thalassica]
MPDVVTTAQDMIAGMSPELRAGRFVFASVTDTAQAAELSAHAISVFREDEGVSLLLPLETTEQAGLPVDLVMQCITLNVYSSLEGTGLTAAVSTALAEQGIPCNMVAAFHHDHVFVPEDQSDAALDVLRALQSSAAPDT